MSSTLEQLTEKEKEALRLIVRGHDAKSAAIELDLSVHTINDRLRHARRKLDVTSSREAARILFESETETPQKLVHEGLGDAVGDPKPENSSSQGANNADRASKMRRFAPLIGGVLVMSIFLVSLAAALMTPAADGPIVQADQHFETVVETDAEIETAASHWLSLVDTYDWEASFNAAGEAFRKPNTIEEWRTASEQARTPLGQVLSRKLVSVQHIASPQSYRVVRFQSDFENREGAVESVTLEREDDKFRVIGYVID